jgi:predicted O-methyltransferase YrrM
MFFTILAYLRYLLKAKGSHALHSPFMFHFYSEVVSIRKPYYAFGAINSLRLSLMQSTQKIHVKDLGAGSKTMGNERTVGQITRKSSASAKEGELLFRIANECSPKTILELGTSIGLSSLYLAMANSQTKVHTIEGCPETAKVAQKNFQMLGAKNIASYVGEIDEILPKTLQKAGKIDLAYLDANHQYEPTLRYFEQILPALSEEAVVIFDDIHWSEGMEKAWNEICQRPEVTISLDLFSLGVVFVSKKFSKEHFVLKF